MDSFPCLECERLRLQNGEQQKRIERLAILCGRIIHDRACVCNEPGHRCGTNLMMEDLEMVLQGFDPVRMEEITKNVMAYAKGLLALKPKHDHTTSPCPRCGAVQPDVDKRKDEMAFVWLIELVRPGVSSMYMKVTGAELGGRTTGCYTGPYEATRFQSKAEAEGVIATLHDSASLRATEHGFAV